MKKYNIMFILLGVSFYATYHSYTQAVHEITSLRPHDNCYWVEPGRFLAGEYPASETIEGTHQKLTGYLDARVTFFLDLTEAHESSNTGHLRPYESIVKELALARGITVEYRRMPIRDMSIPHSQREMDSIITTITTALNQGHNVYVHCWGGIGRTGTVVGCYLAHRGMKGKEALRQIAHWWSTVAKSKFHPYSPQTREQRAFVKRYRK